MSSEASDPQVQGSGRVLVETLSGTRYEIDTVRLRLRRIPAPDRVPAPGDPVSADLRRDGEVLQIRQILRLEVGHRGELVLEPLGHPELVAYTRRSTTVIVSIEPDTRDNEL